MNKEVKIIPPDGHEVDKENSTFERIVFKPIIIKDPFEGYPKNIEDVKGREWRISIFGNAVHEKGLTVLPHQVSSRERAELLLKFGQLLELRDAVWKIEGWKPDWGNDNEEKYSICKVNGFVSLPARYGFFVSLCFKSPETRNWFYNTHKQLIEDCKELL